MNEIEVSIISRILEILENLICPFSTVLEILKNSKFSYVLGVLEILEIHQLFSGAMEDARALCRPLCVLTAMRRQRSLAGWISSLTLISTAASCQEL